ncbi:MAG: hypothetical protein HC862_26100 [Scytonema sp. RU_4_4]|nr:hypothetical protein [Scytonema sp. RU_4_4]
MKKISKISNYDNSNVLVYGKTFYPFVGAGHYYSGWSFSLNLRKDREDTEAFFQSVMLEQEKAVSLDLEELYNYITEKVISLKLDGLTITDKLCVNGQEIRERPFVCHPLSCPESHLDDSVVKYFLKQNTNDNIRYYKNIQVVIWNGQMVLSAFFRFVNFNKKLFIETVYFLLLPVKEEYQEIDKFYSELRLEKIRKFLIKSFSETLFLFPFSLLNLYKNMILETWQNWRQHRQMKRQIRETANFNYGATESIREKASMTEYTQYFQNLDTQMYYKIINQQIIDSLCEFLESKNIDISDLKEKSKVIFNSGVIVSGSSSINTQNLAVGDQSQAVTNNFAPSTPPEGTKSDK